MFFVEVLRLLVAILGFTVMGLTLYRLVTVGKSFTREQQVLLSGITLWGYALTHAAVLRLVNETPFTFRGLIAYVGTLMIVWALAHPVDKRLIEPTWQEVLREEDVIQYKEVMDLLETSVKLRMED